MSNIGIITDSTAYIPDEFINKYQITVVPQVLIWGDEEFKDGVDIMPDEFYTRLENAKRMPSTSQVTPQSFINVYKTLTDKGKEILAILISDKLSGTIASAIQAKENVPEAKVEIIDSKTTAMALGYQVLAVARAAEEGATMKECLELANEAKNCVGVVFAVDTLEFLHRGGRIGGGSRFLGSALKIKPILEVTDGRIEALEQVRTRKKSLERLVDIVEERVAGNSPIRLASLHANAPIDAQTCLEEASKRLNAVESIFSTVSPVIGTHAGPGTVGLAYMVGM